MDATPALADSYSAACESVVIVRREAPGLLALGGPGAAEFLQGQLTNDIQALEPGHGCYAALLTPKGKMRADMRVTRLEDALFLICEQETLPALKHMIDTFRIGYEFIAEDHSAGAALASLVGPEAARAAGTQTPLGEHEGDNAVRKGARGDVVVVRTPLGADIVGDRAAVDHAVRAIVADGVPEAGEDVFEIVRVEHGVPRLGRELDADTIPGEAGLDERAVSFEKGCYVGQETVARLHYKGKPNRALRLLAADAPLAAGAAVTAEDGRALGQIGTAVVSPARGPLALALLRREAESGARVTAEGVGATVLDAGSISA